MGNSNSSVSHASGFIASDPSAKPKRFVIVTRKTKNVMKCGICDVSIEGPSDFLQYLYKPTGLKYPKKKVGAFKKRTDITRLVGECGNAKQPNQKSFIEILELVGNSPFECSSNYASGKYEVFVFQADVKTTEPVSFDGGLITPPSLKSHKSNVLLQSQRNSNDEDWDPWTKQSEPARRKKSPTSNRRGSNASTCVEEQQPVPDIVGYIASFFDSETNDIHDHADVIESQPSPGSSGRPPRPRRKRSPQSDNYEQQLPRRQRSRRRSSGSYDDWHQQPQSRRSHRRSTYEYDVEQW